MVLRHDGVLILVVIFAPK
jgi:ribonuclease HI